MPVETAPSSSEKNGHIAILDSLRGMAALSVCFFHFTCGNTAYLPQGDPVKSVGAYGWLGVEMFFVISGFVIPYSLHVRGYRFRDCGSFLLRRLARIEPPYFACIAICLLLTYVSGLAPGQRATLSTISLSQIAAHVAYLNAILDLGWLNPVFWTLAIEFQYYLFVALIFPILNSNNRTVGVFAIVGVALLGLLGGGNETLLPHWLPLFAVGMTTFRFRASLLSQSQFVVLSVATVLVTYFVMGFPRAAVGCLTALIILSPARFHSSPYLVPLNWAGAISYSLYLLHVPFGMRVINLVIRLPQNSVIRYGGVVAAFAVSLILARFFYRVVEIPSQRLSRGIGRQK